MKKHYLLVMIALFTFCIAGCSLGSKEISCTKDGEKMTVTFKKDKITKVNLETTQTYDDSTLIDMAYQGAQMTANGYNYLKGVKSEALKDNNTITVKTTFNVTEMEETYITLYNYDKNFNEFTKIQTDNGYTCK